MKAFRFVQASDAHLGYMQYGLAERTGDFLKAFEEFTTKAKELSPDFVVFAGDLYSGSLETFDYTEYGHEKGFYLVEVDGDGETKVDTISLSMQRRFRILQMDFTGLKPEEIEEKAREAVSNADEEGVIIVLSIDGTLLQGLTKADVKYEIFRSAAKEALYVHLVNHLRTTEEEALPLTMNS
ncbi:MAG: repair protein SbcD/Mre11 [Thermoproteota archaeon]|nr:repair protein SbcD/Mre11 [Thermoproteota archaeon]